jgi:hypothetical protein
MKRPTTTVTVLARSWGFAGPGALDAIKAVNCPYMRDRDGGRWLVPGRHGEQILEWLEARGYKCEAQL